MLYLTIHQKYHGIFCEHIVRYEFHFNGTEAGEMYIDELSI